MAGVWIIGEYGDVLIDGGNFEDEDTQMEVKRLFYFFSAVNTWKLVMIVMALFFFCYRSLMLRWLAYWNRFSWVLTQINLLVNMF